MILKSLALCAATLLGTAAQAENAPFNWTPPSGMTPGPIAGTNANIVTNSDGIAMQLETVHMTPGHVVTVWFVAIQSPENCTSTPCAPPEGMGSPVLMNTVATLAGGAVISEDGSLSMSGFMPVGDVSGNFFDTQLETPESAEIHLAIHDHGPLNAERAAEMMSGYRAGCTDASVPPFYPETARTDGMVGPFDCKVLQFAYVLQN